MQYRLIYKPVFILLFLLQVSLCTKADTTEIRYHVNGVSKVYLVWGVNDWQRYKSKPQGTIVSGKTMRTPMLKDGEDYVAKLNVDSGNIINFGFVATKKSGPFRVKVDYWDMQNRSNKKKYFVKAGGKQLVRIRALSENLKASGGVSLKNYLLYLLLLFGLPALVILLLRKYYYKKAAPAFSPTGYFVSLSTAMVLGLYFIRIIVTDLMFPMVINPAKSIPETFSASWDDMKLAAILILVFGLLFFTVRKMQRFILVLYTVLVFLVIIASVVNIKVVEMLGHPFNYQWLYYSDFLKSTDAAKSMAANLALPFIAGSLIMLLLVFMIGWLAYQLYNKKMLPVVSIAPIFFLSSFIAQVNTKTDAATASNPVLYFVRSLDAEDALPVVDEKTLAESDFSQKNIDSLAAPYAESFKQYQIKNVVFLVLESTPWEYVSPYSNIKGITPFIDSYKQHAVIFDKIYAHIPSTNKSMFSFLCSSYPELSFKSFTIENPGVPLPSIPSELKKYGYRSAFFNSGDNQYQNAGGFLKARGFDVVEDFRDSDCSEDVFSDKRYTKHNLDGVDDSCLSARLFKWIGKERDQPFFAMMWTFQTHYPYFTSGKEKDFETGNPSLEKYLNALHRADATLKSIVTGLEKRGLLESTLIVISGDHGEAFGRHNQTTHAAALYEENLHVPFILINPLLFKGEHITSVGGISDAAPTIFSVLGKQCPQQWQGENLFSVNRRKRVYFFNPYAGYLFGYREGDYKYIFNASDNSSQLYDLSSDPQEENNIAENNAAFVKEGGKHISSWMAYQNNYMSKILKDTADKAK